MTITDVVRFRIVVRGKVQGVFFRDNVKQRAQELQLKGWVRNKADGAVEVVAEGPKIELSKLVQFCREGPGDAQILDVQFDALKATGEFPDFRIRF